MKKLFLLSLLCLGVSACSVDRVSSFPSYKLTIPQGNELNPQAVAALTPGMTRAQVQILLGTPLLQDPFHSDRWDYPFVITRNGVIKKRTTLSLGFKGDSLSTIEGEAISDAQTALFNEAQPIIEEQPVAKPAKKTKKSRTKKGKAS